MGIEQSEDDDRELFDSLYRTLQHPVRRRLLFGLVDHNPQEAAFVPEDIHIGEKDLDRLATELYHRHLPALEATGLIQWDRDADQVVKGPRFPEVEELLAAIKPYDPTVPDE